MEVIYIDDNYPQDFLVFFAIHGITRPTLNNLYTIRDIIKASAHEGTGLLLQEIVNKPAPVMHPIFQAVVMMETSWNIKRFTTLMGLPLTKEMLDEIRKELQQEKKLQEVTPNRNN